MKRLSLMAYFILSISLIMTSCIKQIEKTFEGQTVVEIDATPLNPVASGVNYPILTRVVPENRPVSTTADSTLRRFSGTVRVRVNVVGLQASTDRTLGYKIFSSPITSIAFPATLLFSSAANTAGRQQPPQPAATLAVQNAVAGTHYTALPGMVSIPANSSFGYIDIQVLNSGSTSGQARFLGIQLDSTGSMLPSPNYLRLGLLIDQR